MEETTEMKPMFDEEDLQSNAKIKVIGIGGGGSNAVNGMLQDKSDEVEYWVMNTDSQALANSPCENKLVLGRNVSHGLGAGGTPESGRLAAEDSIEDIKLVVKGADMVFLACGEGGGTGTGATPVVAKAAKEAGALVLAIVTRPFNFEGKRRSLNALEGINNLTKVVDAIIVVSNDKLMFHNASMRFKDAFEVSDRILASSVKTVTDLILVHGEINLDFADVKATLLGKGLALIGIGYGEGKEKAVKAASSAMNSPLLECSIQGSRSMLINVTISDDTTLDDVQYAVNLINQTASGKDINDVNVIFGVQYDHNLHDKMKIAIIATDFDKKFDFSKIPQPIPRAQSYANPKPETSPIQEAVEKTQIVEEKRSRDDSVLPDYLRQFMNDVKHPEPESKPEPVHSEPVTPKTEEEEPEEEMTPLIPDHTTFR